MNYLTALVSPNGSRSVQRDQLIAGARRDQVMQESRTPAEPPPPTSRVDAWRDSTPLRVAMFASSVGAMGVSYAKNHSIPWAIAHSLIGPAYLVYVGADALMPSTHPEPALARAPAGRRPRRPYIG